MKRLYVAKANGEPKFLIVDNDIYTVEPLNAAPNTMAPAEHPENFAAERNPGSKRKCGNCGETGHNIMQCPTSRHPNHTKPKVKTGDRKVRTCSKCGEPGHMAKTCGRESDDPQEDSEDPTLAAANNPAERAELDDAEIERRVHEMQNQGMSSIAIAVKLHVPLKTVNRFWRNRTSELEN